MIRRLLALLTALVILAAACSGGGEDESSTTSDREDTASSAPDRTDDPDTDDPDTDDPDTDDPELGGEVVEDESGTEIDLTTLDTRVEDALPYQEILGLTLDDLQAFWSVVLPEVYGIEYTPIDPSAMFPYDASTEVPGCPDPMTYDEMAGNAFYCSIGDFVAWDQGTLFPQLYSDFGPFAIAMVMAHEWGHAIQDQTATEGPTVMLEQQADCFAGAWTGYLANGDSELLVLEAGDLELALGGMLEFRDEPGTPVEDPQAHGSGFDRIGAFQEGYTQGPARCAAYVEEPPILIPLQFSDEAEYESGGNLALEEAIDASANDLNDYWLTLFPDFVPVDAISPYDVETELPTCGGTEIDPAVATFNIFFCIDDNYVAWDGDLVDVAYEQTGDFGVSSLLAAQWATSAQVQEGYTEETTATALQRDCLTGAWAGNLYNYTVGGPEAAGREALFSLSPGDLDEVVQAFVAFSVPAGHADAALYGTAFDRVAAFREGFLDGAAVCLSYTEE
jgi:predicted metalloprotease